MCKILITGGSGFLGGHLVRTAQIQRFGVAGTYFSNKASWPGLEWIPFDLVRPDTFRDIFKQIKPRCIIHAAALTRVDEAESHPSRAIRLNVKASEAIARESAAQGVRLIYISTDMVYEGEDSFYTESDGPNPCNFYGKTKWQGEEAVRANNPDHVIVRAALMFGPPGIQGSSFSEWMRGRWEDGRITELFKDQYRSLIFAGNLAEAVLELVRLDYIGTINLGGAERVDRYTFGIVLARHLNLNQSLIRPVNMDEIRFAAPRPRDVSLDISLAKSFLRTRLLGCEEAIRRAYKS